MARDHSENAGASTANGKSAAPNGNDTGSAGTAERRPVRLDLLSRLQDVDLMSEISIVIEGLPEGGQLSAGRNNWDGTWSLKPIHLANLKFMSPETDETDYALTVRVIGIDTDGYGTASTQALFDITVPTTGSGPDADAALSLEELAERLATLEEERRFTQLEVKWQDAQRRKIVAAEIKWRAAIEQRLAELENPPPTPEDGPGTDLDRRLAEAEARRLAKEERHLAESEAKRLAEEERQIAKQEAKRMAEIEKRLAAEEAKQLAEVEAGVVAARAVHLAEQEERIAAAEAERLAEIKRQMADAEAKWKVKEQRQLAALEALLKSNKKPAAADKAAQEAEAEFNRAAEEARASLEKERQEAVAEAKHKAAAARELAAQEAGRLAEEQLSLASEEIKRRIAETRQRAAEDARRWSDEERRRNAEAAAQRALEEKRKAAEIAQLKSREERRRTTRESEGVAKAGSCETSRPDMETSARTGKRKPRSKKAAGAAEAGTVRSKAKSRKPPKSGGRSVAARKDTATEVVEGGEFDEAVRRLEASARPKKVLVVPDEDMAKARAAMRGHNLAGTVKNLAGTKSSRVSKPKKK